MLGGNELCACAVVKLQHSQIIARSALCPEQTGALNDSAASKPQGWRWHWLRFPYWWTGWLLSAFNQSANQIAGARR